MRLRPLLAICVLALVPAVSAGAQARPWQPYEVTLTAASEVANGYAAVPASAGADDRVAVTFTGVSGPARRQRIRVVGFWDGGRTWRVRFAPPAAGAWTYESASSDRGMHGVRGRFTVQPWTAAELAANPTRRGAIRVGREGPRAGHYFARADGTPFLWVADTWWNWTNRRIQPATYRTMVDDRARKGFTLGQLFVAGNGWGRESSLLDTTATVLDVRHMQRVDSMIAYANARGIAVWVHAWWARPDLDRRVGPERMRRWWRYLVHRLGAYDVIWVVGGEYNMHGYAGLGLDFWKGVGVMIDAEDPYDRILGAHNTPPGWDAGDVAPQWSTGSVLHREAWLDYNQSQVGHGRWRNELIPDIVAEDHARTPAKPIVVTEAWYEFVEGNPTGRDVRFGAWSAMLSGAAGHTYGGGHVWRAHTRDSPQGRGAWPLEESFARTTFDYPGAVAMGHLATFFAGVPWWRMAPHPELVGEYADPYALAAPGEEYVAYLRWGGRLTLDLRSAPEAARFETRWLDPATGIVRRGREVNGGGVRVFAAPGDYPGEEHFRDWVLHVRRIDARAGR